MPVSCAAARRGFEAIGDSRADDTDPVRKQQAKTGLAELSDTAQRLLAEAAHDVAWVDKDDRGRRAIVVAPLSVAGTLAAHLYPDRTVVATSATLTLGGRFDTVARSLGLREPAGRKPADDSSDDKGADEDDAPQWTSLDVGSPFEYTKQGILYVAAHLPRPTQSGLSDPAAEELVDLVTALGGRTLGLFSSRRAAERAAEVVRGRTDLPVLLQGEESLPLLVRRFREER